MSMTDKWARRKERLRLNGKTWKVPFDLTGNMLRYCYGMYRGNKLIENSTKYIFKENSVFHETMLIVDSIRGRSSVSIRLMALNTPIDKPRYYYMFLKDFLDMTRQSMIQYSRVTGYWTYVKRGDYYGIKACSEHGDPEPTR